MMQQNKFGIIVIKKEVDKSGNYHHTDRRKIMTLMFQALAFCKST